MPTCRAPRTWVRLHEKGGKRHEMPCHHKLEADLHNYLKALHAAAKKHGVPVEPKAWLLTTTEGHSGIRTGRAMSQPDVYRVIGRRAADVSVAKWRLTKLSSVASLETCTLDSASAGLPELAPRTGPLLWGVLERGGKVRTSVIPNRKKHAIQAEVRKHVEAGSALYSDGFG
jgi:hypothetical protein